MEVHRGTWRIGDVPPWVIIAIQAILIYQAAIRGLDYLGAQPSSAASGLSRADQSAPFGLGLTFWGLVFVAAAAVFVIGMASRWWSWIVAAHVIAAGAYLAVSFGLFVTAFENHYWQGIRTPFGLVAAAGGHAALALGTAASSRQSKIRREGGANGYPH